MIGSARRARVILSGSPRIGVVLAAIVLTMGLLAGPPSGAQTQERAPWQLGAAQLLWRHVPPAGERRCCTPQPATIVVHPQGGVVAVMQRDNMELTISRVTAAGRLQWQTHVSNPGGWVGGTHAHVAFIAVPGEAAIVISLTFSLIALDRDGALLWQRTADELGFAQLGAIRVVRDGHFVRLLVGGWSLPPDDGEPSASERTRIGAAEIEIQLRGAPIWRADIPSLPYLRNGVDTPSPRPAESSELQDERLQDETLRTERSRRTVAVPLAATLPTGGGIFLIGCGGLGAIVTARDIPRPEIPGPPCQATQPIALMRIDGAGQAADAPIGRDARASLTLPDFVLIDAPLQREITDEAPANATLLWHGPRASELIDLLRQREFWNEETHVAYGGAVSTWLHIPAADAVGVGSVSYVLFARREAAEQERVRAPAGLRILVVSVGAARAAVVLDARVAPASRLRLALDERAIYALSRNRILRTPIVRAP